jgi:RNA polymerase sigma factor (TIGR02999 family)
MNEPGDSSQPQNSPRLPAGLPPWIGDYVGWIYAELRRIAERTLAQEHQNGAFEPTSLAHEAWARLLQLQRIDWKDKTHVLAVAALCLRQALIDKIRAERTAKRGGGWKRVELDDESLVSANRSVDLVQMLDALEALGRIDARQTDVVTLRFFGGLTLEEIAKVLEVSPRTVEEDWRLARAWLRRKLSEGESPP